MEVQKTPRDQSSPEKKERSWRCHTPWLQIYYKAISDNQHNMGLAEKQAQRPMEQNWEPRNKLTCMWANNFWQKSQKSYNGEKKASSINGAGEIRNHEKECN